MMLVESLFRHYGNLFGLFHFRAGSVSFAIRNQSLLMVGGGGGERYFHRYQSFLMARNLPSDNFKDPSIL